MTRYSVGIQGGHGDYLGEAVEALDEVEVDMARSGLDLGVALESALEEVAVAEAAAVLEARAAHAIGDGDHGVVDGDDGVFPGVHFEVVSDQRIARGDDAALARRGRCRCWRRRCARSRD